MSPYPSLLTATVAPIMLLLLASCADAPQTPESRDRQATVTACRERAEQLYQLQNRDQLYRTSNSVTPYSGAPTTGLPTQGLSAQYANDVAVSDCIRNTGTQTRRNGGPATPPPAAPEQSGPPLTAPPGAPLAPPAR
jgi:hypothetical protein